MRIKRVNRYYCDFCKKAGCSAGHMKRHEQRCCRNPNRICGFCAIDKLVQKPLEEMKKEWDGTESGLRKITQCCPACMLAVVVQTRPKATNWNDPEDRPSFWFDFKKESAAWWAKRNDAAAMAEASGNY